MFCCVAQRRFSDLLFSLDNAALQRRLPYMGALELTYRCNQECCHCYCNLGIGDRRKKDESSARQIKRFLDEAADAGCFWLLLTGGEVLLREDFWEIYLHAVKRGIFLEVFTNATLIDEAAAARFAEFPPLGMDVSIYGSNPEVHDRITGVEGSFRKTMDGTARLKKHGVRFSLKTILMTLNHADLGNMRNLAASLGAKFRYDTLLCPRTDGGMAPVRYRLSADAMADLDIGDDYESCEKLFAGLWGKKPDEILTCGAGVFAFNINPYGVLSPCTTFLSFQYPLEAMRFADAWRRLVRDYDEKKNDFIAPECRFCDMLLLCPNCPAWSEVEAKNLNARVEYICGYARCLEKKYFKKKEEETHGQKALSKTRD